MRTTVDLPDDLLAQAKRAAIASRRTLTQVIVDAVREAMSRRRRGPTTRSALPVFGEGGVQPGVDLDDSAALVDVMEERADPRR